tara:strand:- start:23325 stop:23663 length:339 start_codon:yes stop_codon:yes gene_type:complete
MGAEQKYIREADYDVAEEFIETISAMDIRTGIKIAKFIEKNFPDVPQSRLVSTVLGGLVMDDDNEPITFALEMIRNESEFIVLSDLQLISMNEYLDLMNLNCKIKSNAGLES